MSLPPAIAANPARSRGRLHPESNSGPRGPRDIFQRDRDRLIHSVAFRRLRHKTQVFVAPDGDHYRVRLTHSIEVAQIGRTMARALGLNEDLIEALCLAHDFGHPPFGHAGEDALSAALEDAGGFDHNAHTVRIITKLETPYPEFDGLNLSWEALEGLAKHNGPVTAPSWAMAEANADLDLELGSWPGLEAQDHGMRADMFLELQQPVFRTAHGHGEHDAIGCRAQAMPQQVEAVGDDELPQADQQSFASARDDSKLDIHHPESPEPWCVPRRGECARGAWGSGIGTRCC